MAKRAESRLLGPRAPGNEKRLTTVEMKSSNDARNSFVQAQLMLTDCRNVSGLQRE